MAPSWARALLLVDRFVHRAVRLEAALRDELLWALATGAERDAIIERIYGDEATYRPGGALFERGLRDWEERVLARPEIPRTGRVLVGGAGGGRELLALCRRGYAVTAFEPCARLADDAARVAAEFAGSRALRGGYGDLAGAVAGSGPLAALVDDAPYAFVLLGWSSLSHVLDDEARRAVFTALAAIARGAPVVASFLPAPAGHSVGRGRRVLRRALSLLGASGDAPRGARFFPAAGFAVELAAEDMRQLAAAAGYRVALLETDPLGLALLVPQ